MPAAEPYPLECPFAATPPKRAWREIEWLVLAALVLAIYFLRLTDLTIRGEESRWARVAQEMAASGDWIVPRQQGIPFADRPPLNSWAMIGVHELTGQWNLLAIRLPSALATLLTTLAIYFYSRNFLTRVGAFAGAAAYATMVQVLLLGRLAESDALLTLFVTASLFCWHFGYACRRDARLAWIFGYALAALAGLTKGPQGPVYFVAIAAAHLCFRRDWRFLFSRWHLAGLATFALVVGIWQVPLLLEVGARTAQSMWSEGGNVASRFQPDHLGKALARWTSYPVEIIACIMPWSFLLPVLATRWLRENLGLARPMAGFLLTACVVALPTCWLAVDSRPRYFMSLYPCVAAAVGLVIERSWQSRQVGWWQRCWDQFSLSAVALMIVAAVAVAVVSVFGPARWHDLRQAVPLPLVLTYVVAAALACATVLLGRRRHSPRHVQASILAIAAFVGFSYTTVVINVQSQISNDPAEAVAAVRALIPAGERLVSFGPVHHLFAYYYEQPIDLRRAPGRQAPRSSPVTYFCFSADPAFRKLNIPFEWDLVAEISCERGRSNNVLTKVIVGRRRASENYDGPDGANDTGIPLALVGRDDGDEPFEEPVLED